jgi:ATP phosphoribosyltransferase
MISKGDVDICAGFAYFTNSNLAWCEFIVSNKKYKEEDRSEALEMLINNIVEACKNAGYKTIFTSVSNENLINKYQNCGFIKAQEGATEMIKFL